MADKTMSKTKLLDELAELRRRVNKLKKTEAKLSQERILLRTLIDNLPDAIYTKDSAGRKTLANLVDVHNLGLQSEKEILGKDDTAFYPPDVAATFMADDRSVLDTGQPVINREEYFFDPGGKKRWLLTTKLPIKDKRANVVGLLGIGRDITERMQMEEALRREKTLMDALMDNIPESIYFKDRQCRLVKVNRRMIQDLNLDDMSQIIGKTDVELFGEKFGRETLEGDQRLMAMGKPIVGLTESRQLENGQINWTLTDKVPMRDDSGQVVGLVGITREINGLMKAQQEREQERNLLRTLIDNLPDYIYFKDCEGRYILNNLPHLRSIGVEHQEEVLGKTTFDFHPRELAEEYWRDEAQVIQSGKALLDKEEVAVHKSSGEKRWHLTSKIPIHDSDGKVLGIVGISRDITEKKRLEEATRESAEKFRLVFETAFDGISIYSDAPEPENRRLIECNARYAEMAGRSREDMLNIGYTSRLMRTLDHGDRQSIGTREAFRGSFTWLRPDNKENIIEYAAVPISMQGKTFTIGIDRDVTEERKSEWKIREQMKVIEQQNLELEKARDLAMEANKTKSAFLASMSHELRTPQNPIIGYSEMVIEEMIDASESRYREDIERIRTAGKHLLGLINEVLDLSKIEAGKMDLYLEDFELSLLVKEVVATVQPLMEKNENTLVVNVPEEMPTLRLDLTKVRQILFNLISNASKFTQRGTITLTAAAASLPDDASSTISLKVSDTGIGLSEEQKAKLFNEFTQADTSTTRKYGGTGLGLAITKRFSEMMHGSIDVESVPNKGTTFTVTLPQRLESTVRTQPLRPDALLRAGSVPAHTAVLVIDDDPSVRDLLLRYLSKEGYHVECVASGDEGLKRAKDILPMMIILDVMMPHKDGWAILQEIKADPILKSTPVIMYTMVDEKNFGLAIGASEYLIKPVSRETILQVVEKYKQRMPSEYVLVVDDDPDLCELASRAIEKAGWKVFTAENGESALSMLKTVTPSLIFLDLMMPVMNGFEFLAAFQNHEEWRHIPIVVITSKDLSSEERLELSGVVKKIIQKGDFTPEKLLGQLSVLIPQLTHTRQSNGSGPNG